MKRKIIKPETPGIFRPGLGEFPEMGTRVDSWVLQGNKLIRYVDEYACDINSEIESLLPGKVVAWQYVPTTPPVDDFEAWCEGWKPFRGLSYENGIYRIDFYEADEEDPEVYELRIAQPHTGSRTSADFPTLIEAQRAAFRHFLDSLNAPEPIDEACI